MLKLPLSVRRTYLKGMNLVTLFVPHGRSRAEVERIVAENRITPEEMAEFRRYFPNGLLGGFITDPENR